ncbi:T9SS type A sorting domain-containing protein [Flavobacterium sp. SM2513]|uniref:T9SS type A sorting domain-containing protein n=1 Tax=Flavobacterium sp. SM2513 TaxID=3424766 RepID=UPI003D7F3336
MKNGITLLLLLFIFNLNAQCFTLIDPANYYSLALKSDHTLWAWGINGQGAYGNGNNTSSLNPVQIGTATDWLSISTGASHTIALKTDGTLWTWGSNYSGYLGDGTTITRTTPVQIGTDTDWQSISTRSNSSFALKTNGTLWGWGQNTGGQVGLGFVSNNVNTPTQIGTDTNWKTVWAGPNHAFALKTDNSLWSWGMNVHGELGNGLFLGGYYTPAQIGTDTDWKVASPGHEHSMALKLDGSLWVWGRNNKGQLGDGTLIDKNVPTAILTGNVWKSIEGHWYSSYAIKNDNSLWSWGLNDGRQLGDGTTIDSHIPKQIGTATDWNYIAAGSYQVMGVKEDNTVYMWGTSATSESPLLPEYTAPTLIIESCSLSTTNFDKNSVNIYPNPTSDKVIVTTKNNEIITNIRVFDLAGKQILEQTNSNEIVVSQISSGIYVLTIQTEKGAQSFKFIKE